MPVTHDWSQPSPTIYRELRGIEKKVCQTHQVVNAESADGDIHTWAEGSNESRSVDGETAVDQLNRSVTCGLSRDASSIVVSRSNVNRFYPPDISKVATPVDARSVPVPTRFVGRVEIVNPVMTPHDEIVVGDHWSGDT